MKKILPLLAAAIMLIGCAHTTNGYRISDGKVSWKNSVIEFSTDMDSRVQDGFSTAFQAVVTGQDGKRIVMPADTAALGYGASCPMGTTGFYKPEKGVILAEPLYQTEDKLILHLQYDKWSILEAPVKLDKQITILRDCPIMTVIDYYSGKFELINIAAGMTKVPGGVVTRIENGYSVKYPNGMTSVIVMPELQEQTDSDVYGSVLLKKAVSSDEPLKYYVGISDKGLDYLLDELAKII